MNNNPLLAGLFTGLGFALGMVVAKKVLEGGALNPPRRRKRR